mgnify:CR=1 FL=1
MLWWIWKRPMLIVVKINYTDWDCSCWRWRNCWNFSTEVNPHEPLLPRISELTGLSDKQLKTAPEFSEVAAKVRELLTDSVFVAHNARFDYGLLEKSFLNAGLEFNEMLRVDTVDLARVFLSNFWKIWFRIIEWKVRFSAWPSACRSFGCVCYSWIIAENRSKNPKVTKKRFGRVA